MKTWSPVSAWFRRTAAALAFSLIWLSLAAPLAQAATQLPMSTPVQVKLATGVSSSNAIVGKMVHGTVASDVVVDGRVVIAAGAPAMGRVIEAQAANFIGIPGKIQIEFKSVQGVDGKDIPLMGAATSAQGTDNMVMSIICGLLCLVGFALRGGDVEMPTGTQVNGFTAGMATVE